MALGSLSLRAAARTLSRSYSRSASPAISNLFFSTSTSQTPTQLPPVLPSPTPSEDDSAGNKATTTFFQRLWDRYSVSGQQRRIQLAEQLFQAATHQAADPRWFGPGRVNRDFRGRHALLTMHIWFLHKRLISDGVDKDTALLIQEELFNILWDDTTCRIRQQGVQELTVNKLLMQVQQYTFLHLTHYDHAYTEFLDKPAERMMELRRIVWQHILVRDPEAEHRVDHLDRIAWYIEANYQNIVMDWPDEYYRQARVAWVDLPDFTRMRDADGTILSENPVHPEDVLPAPWLRNITMRGTEYYWNPITRASTYEKPVVA